MIDLLSPDMLRLFECCLKSTNDIDIFCVDDLIGRCIPVHVFHCMMKSNIPAMHNRVSSKM